MNMNNWQVVAEHQIAEWHRSAAQYRAIQEWRSAERGKKRVARADICERRWQPDLVATLRWLTCRLSRATA